MDKKEFDEKTYKDYKGYLRWKDSNGLVHRSIAYKEIYLKDRKKYPLEFREYQVHHKNKDITDNRVENLELRTIREHELKHGKIRHEYPLIITLFIFLILMLMWLVYLSKTYGYDTLSLRGGAFMMATLIFALILSYFVNRKRKNKTFI